MCLNPSHLEAKVHIVWKASSSREFILQVLFLGTLCLNSPLRRSLLTTSAVLCSWVFIRTAELILMDVPLFVRQAQHLFGHGFEIDEYSEGLLCMGGLVRNRILCQFRQLPAFTCLLLCSSIFSLILTPRFIYSSKPCDQINNFELKYYLFVCFKSLCLTFGVYLMLYIIYSYISLWYYL